MPDVPENVLAALIGAFGGVLLGLSARLGKFCTLGAIEDALYADDTRGCRMWAVALAVAISATFISEALGLIDLSKSIYATNIWNPVASVLGGLMFGYGMALAGNCGFGALSRLGGGDLRALLIVIVMGISAYVTLNGPLGIVRIELFPIEPADPAENLSGFAHLAADVWNVPMLVPALAIAAGFAVFAFASPEFRASGKHALWGAVAGLAIWSGWLGMSWLSEESFDAVRPESHTFTAPLGETILYLMTSTGGTLTFAIGSVCGVLIGSVIGAAYRRHFRWEACDDPKELGRQMGGAVLMGIGGVLAAGCSIGQGLTAFATLSFSAPVVLGSIFVGAAIGLRQLIHGLNPAR